LEPIAENRNARGNGERIGGTFPIRETNGDTKMKNISPSSLPHFHGLTTEDRDTFLSDFVVICQTYDYAEDRQKLKLFPSTLKDATLRWFMGLPGNRITTWAYNTTWKTTTEFTPYELVYGKKSLLSIEFEFNTLRMAAQLDLDLSRAQRERLLQLNGLDEYKLHTLLHTEVAQLQRKIWHDKNIKENQF